MRSAAPDSVSDRRERQVPESPSDEKARHPGKSADPSENRAFLRFALTFDRAGGSASSPASSRAYHDTGVSGALPKKHVSSKGFKVGKRPVVRKVERDDAPTSVDDDADDDPPMSALEEFLLFVEEDFWMFFFAIDEAFSLIAFLLAVASKWRGSRRRLWTKIIVAFVPWTVATTMYLIDPRLESWTLAALKKAYFRYSELRHKPGELLEAVEKWWAWRRSSAAGAGVRGVATKARARWHARA